VKTPEEIARSIWKVDSDLQDQIAAAIQAERDHWTSESNLPRVEEVQGAFREAKLLERIAELENGLEPFAQFISGFTCGYQPEDRIVRMYSSTKQTIEIITVGHCRRAAELLNKTKGVGV
jgi:hypothetical protein